MTDWSWKKLDSESEYKIETLKKSFKIPRDAVSYTINNFFYYKSERYRYLYKLCNKKYYIRYI